MRRFLFRLALQLGCTVRELGQRLDAAELAEWMGFELLEPFGSLRADDRARGIMTAALMAGGAKNIDPSAFLPTWQPAAPEPDIETVIAGWDAAAEGGG